MPMLIHSISVPFAVRFQWLLWLSCKSPGDTDSLADFTQDPTEFKLCVWGKHFYRHFENKRKFLDLSFDLKQRIELVIHSPSSSRRSHLYPVPLSPSSHLHNSQQWQLIPQILLPVATSLKICTEGQLLNCLLQLTESLSWAPSLHLWNQQGSITHTSSPVALFRF